MYTISVELDIGHPCYGQLTPVKKGYMLTGSHGCIVGSGVQLIELTCFFLSFPLTTYWLQFSRRLSFFGGGVIIQFVSLSKNNSCSDSILIIIDIESLQTNNYFLKHPSRVSLLALAKSIIIRQR